MTTSPQRPSRTTRGCNKEEAVTRRDSVQIPLPVEKPLGWWQQARLKLFWPLVAVVVVLTVAVWWMARRMKRE